MSKGKWLNNIARLIKKKDGGYFLKFERQTDKNREYKGESCFPLTINEGDVFQAKLKKDDLQGLVDKGIIDQEKADSICETVKFEFSLAPREESTKAKAPTKKSVPDDEVDF